MRKTVKFIKCQDGYWGSKKLPGSLRKYCGDTCGHGICPDRLEERFSLASDVKTIWIELSNKKTAGASVLVKAGLSISVDGTEEGIFPAVRIYLRPLFFKHGVLFMKIMY